ncbi:MAG: dihydrofolate reductase family protein, partial [Candidatus Eremiobacteraeota bacterium]|nr:dihydrofolate reductase family protein [Candidatus Eremiobacteraeota bacterium]
MPRLIAYTQISLDGYFSDANRDMSWAHNGAADPEWSEFVAGNARGGGTLVMGRITYDLMKSYWPTPLAFQTNRVMA